MNIFRRLSDQAEKIAPLRIMRDGASLPALPVMRLVEGPQQQFRVHHCHGWAGRDIELYLAHYGIRVRGKWDGKEYLRFSVGDRQERYTEYLLNQKGLLGEPEEAQ